MNGYLLWELFLSFIQVGLFSFGGGYAALPLIQTQVVDLHHWLTLSEFTDLITISQMTPGPIAINSATFVGTKLAGLPGAIVATVGCVFPACIICSVLAYFYYKYRELPILQTILNTLRPVVVSLIGAAGVQILSSVISPDQSFSPATLNYYGIGLFLAGLILLFKTKVNPIIVMLLCGLVYLLLGWVGLVP